MSIDTYIHGDPDAELEADAPDETGACPGCGQPLDADCLCDEQEGAE